VEAENCGQNLGAYLVYYDVIKIKMKMRSRSRSRFKKRKNEGEMR